MNITLIGMPGVGKSTTGLALAEFLDYDFVDVDDLIEERAGKKLQEIIDQDGTDTLLQLEESAVVSLSIHGRMVIAPGGSVVYSDPAMSYLRNNSWIIYLRDTPDNIQERITDIDTRGIAGLERGILTLYKERDPLYYKNADYIVDVTDGDPLNAITDKLERHKPFS